MEDKEYELCNKKCKSYLKRDRYGKMVSNELQRVLEMVFREGYKLGKKSKIGDNSEVEK